MNKKDKQMTWYDVTLYQFEKLQDLLKIENEEERMFAIAELLLGEEVTNLPISEFVNATKRLSFLSEEIETKTPPKNLELNGRKYTVDCLLGRISTAQYIDFQNHLKGNDIAVTLSVFIIPKGHKYNDGYDMLQVIDDIKSIPIPIVNSLSFFFQQTIQRIHENFPILFNKGNEDNEYTEGSEGEPNKSGGEFSAFGIIPFVLKFCEVTNHNFEEALNYDVSTLFYIVSYEVVKIKEQEKQIKQMQRRNGSNK